MSAGINEENPPPKLWVLFDVSNGHHPIRNYYWWFTSEGEALEHKEEQEKMPNGADLIGPFEYKRA